MYVFELFKLFDKYKRSFLMFSLKNFSRKLLKISFFDTFRKARLSFLETYMGSSIKLFFIF